MHNNSIKSSSFPFLHSLSIPGKLYGILLAAILLLAAAWKAIFLILNVIPFNADEAIVGLMARHILQGARPTFFYGQAYMGTLDAYLVAAGFSIFGQHVWVIRLIQVILYVAIIATTIQLSTVLFGSRIHSLIPGLILAIPAVGVTLYTTASLGGYGEALLLGNLILLLTWKLAGRLKSPGSHVPYVLFAVWGGLVGLGLWTNGLTIVYSVSSGAYLLSVLVRRLNIIPAFFVCAAAGFLLGSLPWWMFAIENGLSTQVQELLGSAARVESGPLYLRAYQHFQYFLLFTPAVVFGIRPPWSVDGLGLPLIPVVVAFWTFVILFWVHGLRASSRDRRAYALLGGVGLVLLLSYVLTPFGSDVSGRYFLPINVLLALVAAQAARELSSRNFFPVLVIGLLICYHAWGTIQTALRYPPGITTQIYAPYITDHRYDTQLINFLQAQGETRGYTNYWVSYPLAFNSQETLLFTPRLPFHLDMRFTPNGDRYPPYGEEVEASGHVAYISSSHPALDAVLRDGFSSLGVTWEEQQIGDYHIFYKLSRAVRPAEIGLGLLR